jgi:hypothetical protein
MKIGPLRFVAFLLLELCAAGAASAGTVSGVVRNGTTNTPVPGADVILLKLQGGMEGLATTKADAQGRFQFDRPEIGTQPMLLRVQFRGVNFHQPVPPGTQTADVEVFNNTQNPGSIQMPTRMIVLQPNGSTLLVGEEYTIQNQTHPPEAYYRADGTFTFSIPEGAQLNQVAVAGPAGMPVVQGTIDKGKNTSAIAYAFRPGESTVRLSYEMPYPSNEATVHTLSPYAFDRVLIIVPPPVQVLSAGFQPAGTEQGYNVYARDHVAAGAALDIAVSGAGSVASSNGVGGAGQEAAEAQNPSVNSRAGEAEESSQVLPGRLEDVKWILVGGFAALFALGVVYLWKKPQQAAVVSQPNSASEPKHVPQPPAISDVDREVRYSLDEIKENLFRLELRKQAGTISEEEYARQRGRTEKLLRDLVKG